MPTPKRADDPKSSTVLLPSDLSHMSNDVLPGDIKIMPESSMHQTYLASNQAAQEQLQLFRQLLQALGYTGKDDKLLLNFMPRENTKLNSIGKASRSIQNKEFLIFEDRPVVRIYQTPAYIAMSKSHYHNLRNPNSDYFQKSFPEVIEISERCKGHFKSDLDAWLDSKKIKGVGHVSK